MLGMQLPAVNQLESYSLRLEELIQAVGTVLLVRHAQIDHDLLTG